ncbi:hypothetical protein [Microbacterium sp. G2-8]|uniref:hypothetical protein n=1 Tax=Microbacterium sp. G2-8 TaxID=2842454 RepID=UPI001C89394D|nr:hypothetical protein [Microbacterium sp. G2-8]
MVGGSKDSGERAWAWIRAAAAMTTVVAVLAELVHEIRHAGADESAIAVTADFLGRYTNVSVIAAGVVLCLATWSALVRRRPLRSAPAWIGGSLTGVAANLLLVAVIYNALLRNIEPSDAIWWVNEFMHVWLPAYLLVDALAVRQPRGRGQFMWATFPPGIAWCIYFLTRESYPYWFVDPAIIPGGVPGVLGVCIAVLIGVSLVALALQGLNALLHRRSAAEA